VSWLRLDLESATIVAAVLVVVALALRPVRRRWSEWLGAAAIETALVCGLFALWQLANKATHTHIAGGLAHGRWLWHAERVVHFPSEVWAQKLILGHPDLVRASNYYYATAHLTGMAIFLVWLWLRHRDRYPHWRNVVAIFTGIALFIEMIPVAPPRLIGHTGLVDTAMLYGQSVYAYVGSGFADEYAALPSIHVGWAFDHRDCVLHVQHQSMALARCRTRRAYVLRGRRHGEPLLVRRGGRRRRTSCGVGAGAATRSSRARFRGARSGSSSCRTCATTSGDATGRRSRPCRRARGRGSRT